MTMGSPPVFDSSGYSFGVQEDATHVGTVSATDPDDDISDYSLSGVDAGNFDIDSTGTITATYIDFEMQVTHYFDVTVTDMMGNSDTVSVSVVVGDVAEDPVFGAPVAPATEWAFGISEMAHTYDTVGTLPVSDPQGDYIYITVYEGDIADPSTWSQSNAFFAYDDSGTATIQVNDEWELDHETTPEYDLILEADDMNGNTATVGVTVTLTDEIEWDSTGIFVISWEVEILGVGTNRFHAEVLIIPEDQETYETDARFVNKVWVNREEMVYTTVGAGPGGLLGQTLISTTNRSVIDEDDWAQIGTIDTAGCTCDLIDLIFSVDGGYGDNRQYDAIPNADPNVDSWNSNTYAHGLLNALESEDDDVTVDVNLGGLNFPGWNKPLPLAEFGL